MSHAPQTRTVSKLQAFRIAARQEGFLEVPESAWETVLWLCKDAPLANRDLYQRMCIDSVTNSVTIYWMAALGKLNSKTFRGVPAMQEWFKLEPQTILQR